MLGQYPAIIEGASPQHPWEVFHHHVGWAQHTGKVDEAGLHLFAWKQRSYDACEAVWFESCLRTGARQQCCPANWGRHKDGEVWWVLWTSLPPCAQTCERLLNCGCINSGSITDGISCTSKCVDQRNRIVQSKKKSSKTVQNCCEWRPSWNMVVILKSSFPRK